MHILGIALVVLVAKASSVDHPGPAGVPWYSSQADTKGRLEKKWGAPTEQKMEDGVLTELQTYAGEFAGMSADTLEAGFADGKLISFVVVLSAADEQSAVLRWENIIKVMAGEYGPPTSESKPPDVATGLEKLAKTSKKPERKARMEAYAKTQETYVGDRYYRLDAAVREGKWSPKAVWKFKNGVDVTAVVMPSEPDEDGARTLLPLWAFTTKEARKALKAAPKDF